MISSWRLLGVVACLMGAAFAHASDATSGNDGLWYTGPWWESRLLSAAVTSPVSAGPPLGYALVDALAAPDMRANAYGNNRTGVVYIAFHAPISAGPDGTPESTRRLQSQLETAQQFTERVRKARPQADLRFIGAGSGRAIAEGEAARTGYPADVGQTTVATGDAGVSAELSRGFDVYYRDDEVASGIPARDATRVPLVIIGSGIR